MYLISVDGESDEEEEEPKKKQPQQEPSDNVASTSNVPIFTGAAIIHSNYPYLCETYKDLSNQMDKVLLSISVPGGAKHVKMMLNNDGTAVTVKYDWPKIMYNMDDMFSKAVAAKQMNLTDPKVACFKNGLEKRRPRIDAVPQTSIIVNLPIKVQTGENNWTKTGAVRVDGSQIVTGDFSGFIKEYNKKLSEADIVFDQ